MTGYFATAFVSAISHGYDTSINIYEWIANSKEPAKNIQTAGFAVTRENYSDFL